MADNKKEKRRHLGRGLESLLGPITEISEESSAIQSAPTSLNFPPDKELRDSVRQITIGEIKPNPYQPRSNWNEDDLRDLAASIRANGVIQPILVRSVGDEFEIIAGERRLRAAKLAQLERIPALVRNATDAEMLELALVENIHRADLNPVERALAYQKFIETFELTQAQAAERLGENRSVVANYLRLLGLPSDIKQMLIDKALSMGHARAILALPTDELQKKLAGRAMAGRLSVREVERLVRKHLARPSEGATEPKEKPAHIADLESKLRQILGTKVRISANKKGQRGRIIIDFYSLDEFDRLSEKMGLNINDPR